VTAATVAVDADSAAVATVVTVATAIAACSAAVAAVATATAIAACSTTGCTVGRTATGLDGSASDWLSAIDYAGFTDFDGVVRSTFGTGRKRSVGLDGSATARTS
jgi:hypothetical protein